MKARWKIALTLFLPILLICGGIYLKLVVSTKDSRVAYEAYYIRVARPAIDALNNDRAGGSVSADHVLDEKGREAAMSAMLTHSMNRQKHEGAMRRNRIVGYLLVGMLVFATLILFVAYFDKEKKEPNEAT